MFKQMTIAGLSVSMMAVSGCELVSNDPIYTAFHREAGASIDTGNFGNATQNNTLVQSGDRRYTISLAKKFASDVQTMVTFEFNKATITPAAAQVLRQQADWIRQFPEVRFKVYGHTDAVGSDRYNKRLGLRRANAAVRYLVSQGISRSRLEAVVSFGETQPLIVTEGRERRNRRTVTEVSGFIQKGRGHYSDGFYSAIIYRDYIASAVPPSQLTSIVGTDFQTEQ